MEIGNTIYLHTRAEWRNWLQENHEIEYEIWFIYYKKHTGKPSVPYNEAVEEALCFGWIDSLVKRLDDERYVQKYSQRKPKSGWSDLNIRRVKKLIAEGKMTDAGLYKIPAAILSGENLSPIVPTKKEFSVPAFIIEILAENTIAFENFNKLSQSHKKQYVEWILQAKKDETRLKRINEAIDLLEKNKKLTMK